MIPLPQSAQQVIDTLKKAGFQAYAVGGSVRDTLMGRPTHGWDFTTIAKPEEILKLFPDSFYDNEFGTVGIKLPDDIYEITTYRSEKGYTDHRHPDKIQWGKTLEEDLSRRDFTINAIATDGKTVIDPYSGKQDLAAKLIRAVGNADARFEEDALRQMRAVRIASEVGFMIEPETLSAIKKNAASIQQISPERIHDELLRILASPFAADGILLLKSSGLLKEIMPELEEAFAIGQKSPNRHHIYDVGTHSVMAVKNCPSTDPVVRLATLLHDIGKVKTYKLVGDVVTFYNHEVVSTKVAKAILARLKFSNKDTEKVLTLIRWHQFTVDERQTDSALRRFIRHVGKENLEDMLALRIGDRLGGGATETSWRLELFKKRLDEVQQQPFSVTDLKIDGNDVMKVLGVPPGPIVGQTLNDIFAEVETGKLQNEREILLKKIGEIERIDSN
jgi:putative nucleotidyltransferase with HDIG domain